MGKKTIASAGWSVHGDGMKHLIANPTADDIATLRDTPPSEVRLYIIDAVVDGAYCSDVIAVGTMIIPDLASFDGQEPLHPVLRLTLSPYYPTFISYIVDYYVRAYKVKAYLVNLQQVRALN
jgi:hypothetical protein